MLEPASLRLCVTLVLPLRFHLRLRLPRSFFALSLLSPLYSHGFKVADSKVALEHAEDALGVLRVIAALFARRFATAQLLWEFSPVRQHAYRRTVQCCVLCAVLDSPLLPQHPLRTAILCVYLLRRWYDATKREELGKQAEWFEDVAISLIASLDGLSTSVDRDGGWRKTEMERNHAAHWISLSADKCFWFVDAAVRHYVRLNQENLFPGNIMRLWSPGSPGIARQQKGCCTYPLTSAPTTPVCGTQAKPSSTWRCGRSASGLWGTRWCTPAYRRCGRPGSGLWTSGTLQRRQSSCGTPAKPCVLAASGICGAGRPQAAFPPPCLLRPATQRLPTTPVRPCVSCSWRSAHGHRCPPPPTARQAFGGNTLRQLRPPKWFSLATPRLKHAMYTIAYALFVALHAVVIMNDPHDNGPSPAEWCLYVWTIANVAAELQHQSQSALRGGWDLCASGFLLLYFFECDCCPQTPKSCSLTTLRKYKRRCLRWRSS